MSYPHKRLRSDQYYLKNNRTVEYGPFT